jgi:hypothetical protein
MSLVGLSSILNSCSSFLGGVTGRPGAAPKPNGLLDTSVALLLLVDVKENPDPAGTATGAAKLNDGFFSAAVGVVLDAVKEKGLLSPSDACVVLDG